MNTTTTNFQQLYDEYYVDIYRYAYWLSGNSDDAKDITAETFTRLWMNRDNYQATTIKGYLLTISRNLYLQGARKQSTSTLDFDVIDPSPSAEQKTSDSSEFAQVMSARQTQTEVDRTLILMKSYENLTFLEISKILGVSVASLKVKLHRARKKLSKAVDREGIQVIKGIKQ